MAKEKAPKKSVAVETKPIETDHMQEIRSQMDRSVINEQDERDKGNADTKFINGEHWTPEALASRKGRPCLTINDLPTYLDQIDGAIRSNKPGVTVHGVDSLTDPGTAGVISGIIRKIERQSSASRVYGYAGLHTAAGGRGAFRVVTEFSNDEDFDQEMFIRKIKNPYSVYYDPDALQDDKQDGQYFFIVEDISVDSYERKYKGSPIDFTNAGDGFNNWRSGEKVRVAEYFYRKQVNTKMIYVLEDGSLSKEVGENGKYKRKREVPITEIWWEKVDGKSILEGPIKVNGPMFPVVLVWGKELCVDGKVEVRGIARHSKDAVRMYDYWRSSHTETVALAPKNPYLLADTLIGEYKDVWDKAATELFFYLPYKTDANNPTLKPFREQPPTGSPGMLQEIALAGQDKKDTIGIQDAMLGKKSNERSGVALRERRQTGELGHYAYVDNMAEGVKTCGKILVGMIPYIYDRKKTERILGPDYKEKVVGINGEANKDGKIYNLSVGKYDVDIDTGPSYSTQRDEFVDKMGQILPNMTPERVDMISDILFDEMDMPRADEIAKRFRKTLPPGLLDDPVEDDDNKDSSMLGGAEGSPPPNMPAPPPPDPLMELKVQEQTLKNEQEATKLKGLELENQIKEAKLVGEKGNIAAEVEALLAEGGGAE